MSDLRLFADSSTAAARVRARRAAPWCLCLAALLAGGCAMAPTAPRADRPLAQAPAVSDVSRQIEVRSPRGRLGPAEREALLKRLGQQGQATLLQRQLAALATHADVQLTSGNQARLLQDGPASFGAMFAAIERARHTVLVESYIIEDSAIAQQLADLLRRKRAEGVAVALIYDAVGSFSTPPEYFDALRAGGVAVCAFNPVNPLRRPGYWSITHRDHRKIVVVDRTVAYTGGINISAVYSSGSSGSSLRRRARVASEGGGNGEAGWRDTQIELRGPSAGALDALFRSTWASQACGDAPPPAPEPAPQARGPHVVKIVPSSPDDPHAPIYALLLTAIDAARESVHLTMAYFAPGQDMIDALAEAARRGVDVQLVLPSVSDFAPVLYAGQSYYDTLLAAGVRIHELQDAVLHAKTAVIDGVLSTVGSSNMDWRSFTANNEVNAVVFGDDFGDAMQRMFAADVAQSQPITLAQWRERGPLRRAREWLARAFVALW